MRRRCSHCGSMEEMPFTCRYCGQPHCAEHRLPENHACAGLEEYKQQLRERGQLMTESPEVRVRREIEDEPSAGGAGGGLTGGLKQLGLGGSGGRTGRGGPGGPGGPGGGPVRRRATFGHLLQGRATYVLLGLMVAVTVAGFLVRASAGRSVFITHFTVSTGSALAPWSLVTSIFAHADLSHILLNGIVLFFFGPAVERRIGGQDLAVLFLLSGVVAGIAQLAFGFALGAPVPVLGASGAILAIMGVLLVLEPNATVLLLFIIPMPLWVVVVGYAIIDFVSLVAQPVGGGVAHLAHLVGLAIGILAARQLYARRRAAGSSVWGT